jgi:hypothetical protein
MDSKCSWKIKTAGTARPPTEVLRIRPGPVIEGLLHGFGADLDKGQTLSTLAR